MRDGGLGEEHSASASGRSTCRAGSAATPGRLGVRRCRPHVGWGGWACGRTGHAVESGW
ncbi:hypothetical protein FHS29_000953 [Saccharothrix tamanrassetensis]|uniref:Uncharacterized protein n=1 Tax=Saccharothrix tamanrassetensis TaxID=1051531 RepID=A0A841CBR1_9PSEU|nr:hypothetical protein [Saccharothrix tamanrassetensis]